MSKRLEDFADQNRELFDSYEPGKRVWENIEKQLPGKKNKTGTLINMEKVEHGCCLGNSDNGVHLLPPAT
jgi:hypothetical protein